ncbi:hypothetical protein [Azonexus fungiphilus]|uniref:hypothetical protein n=1 Tax=Azonexus fungiphilus TaxID=146940 RepID=UPI00156B240D|nr:hypothetical protein [Azonexus fungiphilus]NHC06892.1 hypothetical protein [Azonexus fungiphilus]
MNKARHLPGFVFLGLPLFGLSGRSGAWLTWSAMQSASSHSLINHKIQKLLFETKM